MKSVIIYASMHHGNTKKVVDAIARECGVELIDATQVHEKDLEDYDLIGFASGIFYSKYHQQVLNFASINLPAGKDVFFIATAGNPIEYNYKSIAEVVKEKGCNEVGRFQCKGFDTFGPFKLIGGLQKGHPDEEDLKAAVVFYKGIIGDHV